MQSYAVYPIMSLLSNQNTVLREYFSTNLEVFFVTENIVRMPLKKNNNRNFIL